MGVLPLPSAIMKNKVQYLFPVVLGLLTLNTGCIKDSPTDSNSQNGTKNYSYHIDDFEDGDRFNSYNGYWFTYNDKELGGSSQVIPINFQPSNGSAEGGEKCARITGQVTTTYSKGYVGLGTHLSQTESAVNLAAYQHIGFWAKGDGKNYRFKIKSSATPDQDDFGYSFVSSSNWTYYQISFSELSQEGWGDKVELNTALKAVLSLNWQSLGQPHSNIELSIDNIGLIK